jgi:hypothetical protein
MKAMTEITPDLLDNGDQFKNSFFSRFDLRYAPKPLQLNETVTKNYLFPTLYGDVTCAIGIFMCSYEKAEKMMMHPAIKPVRMPRGRSLVVFSCYIYNKVLGVAPYNEIAMTIPVMVDPGINVPVLPMIAPIFKNFGYYVFSMPVTSYENQIRGVKIWGLPKVVQQIDLDLSLCYGPLTHTFSILSTHSCSSLAKNENHQWKEGKYNESQNTKITAPSRRAHTANFVDASQRAG